MTPDPTDRETLAHLAYLDRRRTRLCSQLSVARGAVENLERELQTAQDEYNLAVAHYRRRAAAPLIET